MMSEFLAIPLIASTFQKSKENEPQVSTIQRELEIRALRGKIQKLSYPLNELIASSLTTFNFEIGTFRRLISFIVEPRSAMPKTRVNFKLGIFREPDTFLYSKTGMISQIGSTGKQRQHLAKVLNLDLPFESIDITLNVLNGKIDTIDLKVTIIVEDY